MTRPDPNRFPLARHPDTPDPWVRGLDVDLRLGAGGVFGLQYGLRADLERIRIPDPLPPGRADGLWRHTCFEAFLAVEGTPGYWELNLSPSGHWQVYRFDGYRAGGREAEARDPGIAVRRESHGLILEAAIRLPDLPPDGRLHLGLCAVVEEGGGGLSYWALRHPRGRPDFHHPDAFALAMDLEDGRQTPYMAHLPEGNAP